MCLRMVHLKVQRQGPDASIPTPHRLNIAPVALCPCVSEWYLPAQTKQDPRGCGESIKTTKRKKGWVRVLENVLLCREDGLHRVLTTQKRTRNWVSATQCSPHPSGKVQTQPEDLPFVAPVCVFASLISLSQPTVVP